MADLNIGYMAAVFIRLGTQIKKKLPESAISLTYLWAAHPAAQDKYTNPKLKSFLYLTNRYHDEKSNLVSNFPHLSDPPVTAGRSFYAIGGRGMVFSRMHGFSGKRFR